MKRVVLIAALLFPHAVPAQRPASPPAPEPGIVIAPGEPQVPAPPVAPAPQPPRDLGKWWKNSEIVRNLQLTEAQIGQIVQTFLEHRLKLIDLRAEVERQETRLQPLIEADQPDEAKISAQLDLVLGARAKLEKANAMMMLAIRRVLTVEQWKKLEAIREERERFRRQPMAAPGAGPAGTPTPRLPRPPEFGNS